MRDEALLELHRQLVAIPSVSGQEAALAAHLEGVLGGLGLAPARVGDSLLVLLGQGPLLCLDTHLDTVPPAPGWSRDPFTPTVEAGRVYGLGSNDAKAAVAAMVAAVARLRPEVEELGVTLALMLVAGEETGGGGTEAVLGRLRQLGLAPAAVVVGEPTGLEVMHAQKGLMVVELCARGQACHAAHAAALGAVNPIRVLARDLEALAEVDLGPPHPGLGPVTVEPTVIAGGEARNAVPAEARCTLDVRTNPAPPPAAVAEAIAGAVASEVRVLSRRLGPYETPADHPLVRAAVALPGARGPAASRTVSDLAHFHGVPGIKCGPGESRRSHTADEFVLEEEVLAGARWYAALVRAWAEVLRAGGGAPPAAEARGASI